MVKLLTTKFNLPTRNNQWITRPRLLEQLNAGLGGDCSLTLVCAPAGYGKTTVVGDWIQLAGAGEGPDLDRVAWLTLDQSDNDLGRFLLYLISAVQQIEPKVGSGIIESLQIPRPPSPDTLGTWLVNDLAQLKAGLILVLDDYHLITTPAIHDFVSFLIDHKPVGVSLLILTRADPPLPLARMRARGQLVELRQQDLRFSPAEVEGFLEKALTKSLTEEQAASLLDRTEGWIAGLKLAALSLRRVEDISSFIRNFSGENIHIADFLTDEVLGQQPEEIQNFLLKTSILRQFSAPLCRAVTGESASQEMLERLVEENLFLIPLDQQGEWYRYHDLFADLLSKRLPRTYPDAIPELHLKASRWYQENGLFDQAIAHNLAGEDYEGAAELISGLAEELLKRGEFNTLQSWLEALPDEFMLSRPLLLITQGLVLLLSGNPPDYPETQLEMIDSPAILADIEGELEAFKGVRALMRGDSLEAIRQSENALACLGSEKSFFRSLAADSLGMAYTLQGDSQAATTAFQQVVEIAERSDNVMMAIGALSNQAGLLVLQGRLRAASDAYQRVLKLAADRLGNRSQLTGKASLGLGMLAREWNDLDGALAHYEEAAEMFSSSVEIGLPIVYLSLAMVKENQGDGAAAQEFLDQAYYFSQASTTTRLDDQLTEEAQARFWISRGQSDLAGDWLQSKGYLEPSFVAALEAEDKGAVSGVLANQNVYLVLARYYLALGEPVQSLEVIQPLLGIFREKGYLRREIELLGLKALALKQQGDLDSALAALDQALSLAKPESYRRTFLDEGEPMAQLLYAAAEEGIHPTYTGSLLTAFSEEASKIDPSSRVWEASEKLVEPLSPREIDVLTLIAEGNSNQEIGGKLHISLSTVKSHTTQIYAKLAVKNRVQAVKKARSLGLLPLI